MINLRKPGTAILTPGSVQKEHLAEGSVDASKIEDGAIDLSTAKVVGELPETKLANDAVTENKIAAQAVSDGKLKDGAVLEAKIADLAISTGKLKDNVVTLAKTTDDVRLTPFVGGEEEQSVTGTTAVGVVETGMSKVSGKFEPKKIRIIADLKTSEGTGYMEVYADAEVTPRLTLQTVETEYELVNGEFSVEDLTQGKHKYTVKLKGSLVTSIVSSDYVEIYTVK
jgi:hypothetical protein